jgi:hypothetical protein
MDIQNLVRERVIGNIKTGMKGENGVPKKLSYFHVEEDKGTTYEMVDIFKQLYPDKPTKLKIRFTTENPFNFKFKRYVNGKAACIGNGTKAITVGKDARNNNTQIEIECNEQCPHRQSGKCKLKGSLKFELEGINAGGVWNLSTSGGISLSNIASEIVKYRKAGMSIVGVPFELTLTEQQSLAYGTYYSIDLHRSDIKPQLVDDTTPKLIQTSTQETKQLAEGVGKEEKTLKKETKKVKEENKVIEMKEKEEKIESPNKPEETKKEDFSNYMVTKKFLPTLVNGQKFDKIIFEDMNGQDVEYILHPKANQDILKYSVGTLIEMESSKVEANMNVLCKYSIKQTINADGTVSEFKDEELKEAV